MNRLLCAALLFTGCAVLPHGSVQQSFLQITYISGGDAPIAQSAKVFDGGVAEITSGRVSTFLVLQPDKLDELRAIVNDPRFEKSLRSDNTCCDRATIVIMASSNGREVYAQILNENQKPLVTPFLDRINAILAGAFGSRWNPTR